MATAQPRSSGLFSGIVLISVGVLILLHNYGHIELHSFFTRWWPLLIIFWGVVKLYERTVGSRFGSGGITTGEVFLVIGMFALLGAVLVSEIIRDKVPGALVNMGDKFSFDIDVPSKAIPANARVLIRNGRGDLTIRATDDETIHVSAKSEVNAWSETEAQRISKGIGVEIAKNGDAFEIRPKGMDLSDSRLGVTMDVDVPKNSPIIVKTEKGDVSVSDFLADVNVTDQTGDVDVRNTMGDVSIELHKGDAKVSDSHGDIKVSGKGGEIEVTNATGSLTVDGDFYGPVRADHVAKGVRMISPKTDMTLSALSGHLEAGSGNLEITDAPGNLTLRTRDTEINVENISGKVNIDNRNAVTNVRFSAIPQDDIQITNSSGEISLTLPSGSSFEIQADCRECDITSEFPDLDPSKDAGNAHLAGKYGGGRGPKISLKTSYGNIELRRTSVALPPKPAAPPKPMPAPHAKIPQPPAPIPPPTDQ